MQNRHVETRSIGVVFLDDTKFLEDFRERLGLHTFAGMRERARQAEYDLLLLFCSDQGSRKAGAEVRYLDRRYDGIVFVGQCPRPLLEALTTYQLPTVVCFSNDTPPGVVNVMADNEMAMQIVVEHLVNLGHRRVAHLAGPIWSSEAKERREAYSKALQSLERHQCALRIFEGATWGGDIQTMLPIVDAILETKVTAVVCANDFLAKDLWMALEQRGLRVPEDVSLTGMDNIDEAAALGLTSIVNPFFQIGQQAIDSLLNIIRGGDGKDATQRLPVELVCRSSVSRQWETSSVHS
jgi:DNA-binding LacI/PurR family transcriptional regulator